jgi:tetratricopeptide (TPR) repeat protein
MPSVSASLIARNEERFLFACLESLRGQVGEVVVADTGSTDRTAEIARDAGARVLRFDWTGSFSEARNRCLEACRGDWILYIDADECLRMAPGLNLSTEIDRPDWAAAMVKFRPKTGFTRYWEHRLFRRHPDIRFEGRIHETHVLAVKTFAARNGLEIGRADVGIDHFGYDGDQSPKHPRNLPLLLDSIETNPKRPYLWYHLAETYAALGRSEEALAAGERGLILAGESTSDKEAVDVNLLAQAVARLRIESGIDPSPVIDAALQCFPGDWAMTFLKARWFLLQNRALDAIALLDQLLSINPSQLPPGLMAFDEQIFGSFARNLKAAALVKLGDIAGAAVLLRQPSGMESGPHR